MITRKLSDNETALKIELEYQRVQDWDAKNWNRCVENWRMYWGIDADKGFGQWPPEVAAQMVLQGRQVATYNLCRPTVDNVAGSLCKSPFNFDFSPVDSEVNSLTYRIKDLQYQEQELLDWKSQELELYVGGLTYQASWEMYLTDEYAKRGTCQKNIGFRTLLPGTIKYDPYWKSARSKDCRKAWKDSWLTPLQMLEYFGKKNKKIWKDIVKAVAFKSGGKEELERLCELQDAIGDEYGYNTGVIPYMENEDIWGSQYKVIFFYEMVDTPRKFEFVITQEGEHVEIPSEIENPDEKLMWLRENIPMWDDEMLMSVFVGEETERIQYVSAICPGLAHGMLLCSGPTEIQCGRLQFFPWSAYRVNGEFGGLIDAIKDMQQSINYLESMLTYKLQIEGGGGAQFVEPGIFLNDAEYQRWVKERNNPQAVFRLKTNSLLRYPNGPSRPVVMSPYPAEAMNRLAHIVDTMWGKISKVAPAARGETESAGESGYLFRLKQIQSDIELYTVHESLRNFWNEIGEAYLYQAIQTHGDGMERTFYNPQTKGSFTINKKELYVDTDGSIIEVIIDDISKLKEIRHKVIITESSDSPTRKLETMQTASTFLERTDPNSKPLTYQMLTSKMVLASDLFNTEEKAELEQATNLEIEVAKSELEARKANAMVAAQQAMVSMQQLQNPPPPQGGGGANVHPVTGQTIDEMQNGGGKTSVHPVTGQTIEEIGRPPPEIVKEMQPTLTE